jgi:hypothetical protein
VPTITLPPLKMPARLVSEKSTSDRVEVEAWRSNNQRRDVESMNWWRWNAGVHANYGTSTLVI